MNAKTDAPPPAAPSAPVQRKPRFALFIATVCGLGYIPIAPGTWGSLAGLALALVPWWTLFGTSLIVDIHLPRPIDPLFPAQIALAILTGAVGVWSANRAAEFWRAKDPQRVVIDEVSGNTSPCSSAASCPFGGKWRSPLRTQDSVSSPCTRRLAGNICSWVLYFFGCSIFGSRFRRVRRSGCRAAGVSWRTTGSPEFTPRWDCGSRGPRGCDRTTPVSCMFDAFLFRRPGLQPRRNACIIDWALAPEERLHGF